ncbi:MAG TPA: hypothetical protein VGD37_29735 [Kofleriaceae bacterium]|jgi:hypothetical protein
MASSAMCAGARALAQIWVISTKHSLLFIAPAALEIVRRPSLTVTFGDAAERDQSESDPHHATFLRVGALEPE